MSSPPKELAHLRRETVAGGERWVYGRPCTTSRFTPTRWIPAQGDTRPGQVRRAQVCERCWERIPHAKPGDGSRSDTRAYFDLGTQLYRCLKCGAE